MARDARSVPSLDGLRETRAAVEQLGDTDTVDLVTGIVSELEKSAWFCELPSRPDVNHSDVRVRGMVARSSRAHAAASGRAQDPRRRRQCREPSPTDVDLDALVAEILEAHEVKARDMEVVLRCAIEVRSIVADVDLLRRVIENLLDNAIRHAPERSEVRITATKCEGAVEIRVADAGPGISPEMREKIFERFVQVESGEHVVPRIGHGLGLAFSKLAIEAHGGTIWVEEGKPGTVFCVRLPDER
jgi:signal transduction histidine kinase